MGYIYIMKKGGSLASDKVNSLVAKSQDLNKAEYQQNIVSPTSKCFKVNNYSTVYKTTGGKKKTTKGGSLASDSVNNLVSKKADMSKIDYPHLKTVPPARCFTVNNYSSVYKTTGGKKKKSKKGGRVLLPNRYFNPNNYGNYKSENNYSNCLPKYSKGGKKTKKQKVGKKSKKQKGGKNE